MLCYLKIHEHGHKSKRTERKESCNLHRENMLIRKKKQSIPLQSSRKETKIECTHPKF